MGMGRFFNSMDGAGELFSDEVGQQLIEEERWVEK